MSSSNERMLRSERLIRQLTDVEQLIKEIEENRGAILIPEESPFDSHQSLESTDGRIETLENISGKKFNYLTGTEKFEDTTILNGNIENYIGMTMIPTGVIGPVKVLGTAAKGDFYVPMATSEGALVASYQRGSKATRMSGGITSVCLVEVVQRSPVFKFTDLSDLGKVLIWVIQLKPVFEKITLENSRYADLQDMKANVEGNHLILSFEFYCGDASGQNMVTLCADAICKYILENTPVKPNTWYIESNYSGDKKATASSFVNTRGRKVTSECLLPKAVVAKVLRTTPEKMQEYWITSTIGIVQSGAIGAQGHFSNGLAAIFMAAGQDVACISEESVGITRMEATSGGDLYVSVTLPNLIVGTVGGGTSLPTQKECLEIMNCYGTGNARKFAEVIGAVILGGEISIAAALSAGHFTRAHKLLGRKK